MRIPSSIEGSHIQNAIAKIDMQKPRLPARRDSTVYDLYHGHRTYPPKYLIGIANEFANGIELRGFQGGDQSNNFLIARGFTRIRNKKTGEWVKPLAEDENDAKVYFEGEESYARHRKLERNPKLAKKVKNKRLKDKGDLCCEVCGFSFQRFYGPAGANFIEAHHTVPISTFKGRRITRLEEIALVCSNCHRMLHRINPLASIADLQRRVKKFSVLKK